MSEEIQRKGGEARRAGKSQYGRLEAKMEGISKQISWIPWTVSAIIALGILITSILS